eukprot:542831_1
MMHILLRDRIFLFFMNDLQTLFGVTSVNKFTHSLVLQVNTRLKTNIYQKLLLTFWNYCKQTMVYQVDLMLGVDMSMMYTIMEQTPKGWSVCFGTGDVKIRFVCKLLRKLIK